MSSMVSLIGSPLPCVSRSSELINLNAIRLLLVEDCLAQASNLPHSMFPLPVCQFIPYSQGSLQRMTTREYLLRLSLPTGKYNPSKVGQENNSRQRLLGGWAYQRLIFFYLCCSLDTLITLKTKMKLVVAPVTVSFYTKHITLLLTLYTLIHILNSQLMFQTAGQFSNSGEIR